MGSKGGDERKRRVPSRRPLKLIERRNARGGPRREDWMAMILNVCVRRRVRALVGPRSQVHVRGERVAGTRGPEWYAVRNQPEVPASWSGGAVRLLFLGENGHAREVREAERSV